MTLRNGATLGERPAGFDNVVERGRCSFNGMVPFLLFLILIAIVFGKEAAKTVLGLVLLLSSLAVVAVVGFIFWA